MSKGLETQLMDQVGRLDVSIADTSQRLEEHQGYMDECMRKVKEQKAKVRAHVKSALPRD